MFFPLSSTEIRIYILSALAAVIALTVHEFSHGYAAYKLGDSTAKNFGRLSFNPLKHLDIFGTLCLIFFKVGWAKPVPIDARNFKRPKRDFAITAICGPAVNLIISFLTAGIYLLYMALMRGVVFEEGFVFNLAQTAADFLYLFYAINLGLGIFNLIPIPPLDGSRILHLVLPERTYFSIMRNERKIYLFVVAWLLLGDILCGALRSVPLVQSTPLLYNLSAILSLSDLLGYAIGAVGDLFFKFWELIPYLR